MELPLFFLVPFIMAIKSTPVITRQGWAHKKAHMDFCSKVLHANKNFYALEEIRNISGIPADINVHFKTGNVFYTLISEDMKMQLQTWREGEIEDINVAGLGQSTTIDNLNDIIYLGTDNGVYKYREDGAIELFTALGDDVMYLAVSNNGKTMYIATWPQNRVNKITNDGQRIERFTTIPNGHGLTVDPRNNIYFVASKTLYILRPDSQIPVKIKGMPSDKMTNVFVSRSDEVYAMDENSNMYSIDPEIAKAKFVGNFKIEGVNSFALDAFDNVLIGVKGSILKYKLYESDPCEDNNNMNLQYRPVVMTKSETIKAPFAAKRGKRRKQKRKHQKTTTSTTQASTEGEDEDTNEVI